MSGVAIIRYLLSTASGVTALVPAERIMAGDLPIATTMPALGIKQISSIPRLTLSMTGTKMPADRVQVTALVKGPEGTPQGNGYPGVRALLAAALAACPNQHGTVNGFNVDSILPDLEGPDLYDPDTAIYSCSRDFIVRWRP